MQMKVEGLQEGAEVGTSQEENNGGYNTVAKIAERGFTDDQVILHLVLSSDHSFKSIDSTDFKLATSGRLVRQRTHYSQVCIEWP